MDLATFTSLNGRISRKTWWLGLIVILILSTILYFILGALLGTSLMGMTPEKLKEPGFFEEYMKKAAWQQLISLVVLGFPVTALMSQRLNDRDRPSWLVWLFWIPTIVSVVLGLLGLSYTMTEMQGMKVPTPTTLGWIATAAATIFGLWALIEMGFLRGTEGPNQHGPNPVAD